MNKEILDRGSYETFRRKYGPVPMGADYSHEVLVHRNVSLRSQDVLNKIADSIDPCYATRKEGRFTVTIVHPDDINSIIEQSKFKGLPVANQIAKVLDYKFPDTLCEPVFADVFGIEQFHDKIGLKLDYPWLGEEFQVIANAIKQSFGINYDWKNVKLHATIAEGKVEDLANISDLTDMLPEFISLTPAHIKISETQLQVAS